MQGQFINDKQVLLRAAQEAGISGAQQLIDDEDQLKSEVHCRPLHPGKPEPRTPALLICMYEVGIADHAKGCFSRSS